MFGGFLGLINLKRSTSWLTFLLGLAVLFSQPLAAKVGSSKPTIDVVLQPIFDNDAIPSLLVTMSLSSPNLSAGDVLLQMPIVLVGTPTAAYSAGAIFATDDIGALKLTASDGESNSSGTYREYSVDRKTIGPITLQYRSPTRVVGPKTRNGPLFDWRSEGGGMIGAGVYFFAVPPGEVKHNISLSWNLPLGMRGISSRGEGRHSWVDQPDSLAFSFYAVGPVQSVPQDGLGNFVFYWLSPPPFDPAEVGTNAEILFQFMAAFFGESGRAYRIFTRSNPYPSGGGTALARSFMFGYGNKGKSSAEDNHMLVAHEMAHTWPKMKGDHALTAWYTEGAAEFYSVLLSLRAGTIDKERFLSLINRKSESYYTGPYRDLSNAKAGKIFWKDWRAQRLPYERGFLYLASLNGQIREASRGQRSVDALVLEVLRRQRAGEPFGLADWRKLVVAELGKSAGQDFDDMTAGKPIAPPKKAFAPCYKLVPATLTRFELGFSDTRQDLVTDLRAGSAAALAGLLEDDQIIEMTPTAEVRRDPTAKMRMQIRRADQDITLRYFPRSNPVTGWQWERATGVPDDVCKL